MVLANRSLRFGGSVNGHDEAEPIDWRYLPYIRPIFQAYVREYPHKIWPYMVQYLHFRSLKFPLNLDVPPNKSHGKMEWFKGTSTGNHGFLPSNFPIIQFCDIGKWWFNIPILLHGDGICINITPKITRKRRYIYQRHGSHLGWMKNRTKRWFLYGVPHINGL